MLALANTSRPFRSNGTCNSRSIRSATNEASSGLSKSSNRMANSSPPNRDTVSPFRTREASRCDGTVYHHILRSNPSESVFISGAVEAVKAVGRISVFQALWEGSLELGTCLDRFHRAAVSTAWARPESERSTSAAGTDFWKGLGWIQTGVWPALSVAAFERTTQVEVPPLSFFVFIQTSLPGWCLTVALLVDVVVWMIVGNPQYR